MKRDLSRLARPSGALAMVAVDQREALRGMFAKHQSTPVPDSQLTQFKVDVARELSPYGSGLLVDQEFGLDAIVDAKVMSSNCGLIAAADLLIGPAGGAATDTAVDPDVDPVRMKAIGSAGLKFLVLWRNDESPESRMKLVNEFNALCDAVDLPSIIEVIVKAPNDSSKSWDREAELISAIALSKSLPNIRLRGLMGMASFTADTAKVQQEFRVLKGFFDRFALLKDSIRTLLMHEAAHLINIIDDDEAEDDKSGPTLH